MCAHFYPWDLACHVVIYRLPIRKAVCTKNRKCLQYIEKKNQLWEVCTPCTMKHAILVKTHLHEKSWPKVSLIWLCGISGNACGNIALSKKSNSESVKHTNFKGSISILRGSITHVILPMRSAGVVPYKQALCHDLVDVVPMMAKYSFQ